MTPRPSTEPRRYPRVIAAAVAIIAVLVVGVTLAAGDPADDRETDGARGTITTLPPTSSSPEPTSPPPTTSPPTTTPPSTTTPPTTTPPPPAEPAVLEMGSRGPRTLALQQRLAELRYDPGAVDGDFGSLTRMAVWAFQKVNGLPADGKVGLATQAALDAGAAPAALVPNGGADRVEIDLGRQVLFLYDNGRLALITHLSSGTGESYCDNGVCGVAVTPTGDYTVYRRVDGWRHAPLGELYNPLYFNGGIAVHGSPSVPNYPASHGCVRVPMHIAEYLPGLVANGEPVYVR
jgi:peptidoglycan hydrolase-like protein with peptidoglycan-binding domain